MCLCQELSANAGMEIVKAGIATLVIHKQFALVHACMHTMIRSSRDDEISNFYKVSDL